MNGPKKEFLFICALISFCVAMFGFCTGVGAKQSSDCSIKARWGYLVPVHYIACRFAFFMSEEG